MKQHLLVCQIDFRSKSASITPKQNEYKVIFKHLVFSVSGVKRGPMTFVRHCLFDNLILFDLPACCS